MDTAAWLLNWCKALMRTLSKQSYHCCECITLNRQEFGSLPLLTHSKCLELGLQFAGLKFQFATKCSMRSISAWFVKLAAMWRARSAVSRLLLTALLNSSVFIIGRLSLVVHGTAGPNSADRPASCDGRPSNRAMRYNNEQRGDLGM